MSIEIQFELFFMLNSLSENLHRYSVEHKRVETFSLVFRSFRHTPVYFT
jgi:hypothetical protein